MNSWIHTGLPRTAGKTSPKNSLMKAANVFGAILLLVSMVTFSVASFAQTVTPFTSTTTWTCPVGVTSVTVSCWGAGGGGSTASTNPLRGGGGGGGAFARSSVAVVPGTTYTVTVGTGGGANTAGGDSWFSTNTTILAKGGGGGTNNSSTAGAGGSSTNSIGTIKAAGGNGGTGSSGNSNAGGGAAGLGTGSGLAGGNASGSTAGTGNSGIASNAGTGAAGVGNGSNGGTGVNYGGGGSGGNCNSGTTRTGGSGAGGYVSLSYNQLTYLSQFISADFGSLNWTPGETRTVVVKVKNVGTAVWKDSTGRDLNIGVKWNGWSDYHVRQDVGIINPGDTGTYTFSVTASNNAGAGYTTPLTPGSNNLVFDMVYEAISWFGTNAGGTGPGNSAFTSSAITINNTLFTSSGSFTPPPGVTSIKVEAWGAGGGGGSRSSTGQAGGGGGGAYASSTVTVTPGTAYSYTVGSGGTAGNSGGNTTFNSSTVIAAGGAGVANNITTGGAGGTTANSTGTTKNAGGNGGATSGSTSGGGGGAGGETGAGTAGSGTGVAGIGNGNYGGDGGTGVTGNTNGNAGGAYGGGGSGSTRTSNGNTTGGTGGGGLIFISFNSPTYRLTGVSASSSCASETSTITLSANASDLPLGSYTVTYSLTGSNTATNSTASFTVTTAGSGSFSTAALANTGTTTITISQIASTSGSVNFTSIISANNTASITTNAKPTASISGTATGCSPVSLTASGGVSYSWSGGESSTSATNTFTTSNTYTVTVTDANGCTNTASQAVTIIASPGSVTASASANVSCGATTVNLTGSATGATAATVAFQGFESAGSTVAYISSGGGTKSGTSASGDRPASVSFVNGGSGSYWINNGTATITTANITGLSGYSAKKVSLNLASFSIGSTNNGADASDVVTVAISLNGGSSYSDELSVNGGGTGNSFWAFSTGTGVATVTYDGLNIPTSFAPTGGGARTTDGYELLEINLPDTCSQVRVRITMVNSSNSEAWVVDDITLTGTQMRYSWTSNPAGFTSGFQNPSGVSVSATTVYTLTATNGSGCTATDTANVTINVPSAPTGTAGSRCGTGTVSISATPGSGETIDWYAAASGGSVLSGGTGVTSFTTPSISTTTNYFAQARNTTTGCLSGTRTSVTATINPTPTISNQSSSSAYGTATTYTITATNAASFSAASLPTGITLNTATGVLTIAADCPVGVYSISVSVTSSAGCNGAAAATVTYTRTTKALTITGATTTNKEYDGNTSASVTGGTLVGVVGSDVVTLTQAGTFANKTVGTNKAITSACSISGANASNYTLTQPTLTARNITAKPLTVTGAVASNKVYNGNTTATITGGSLVGVISPDVVNLTQAGTFVDKNVGTGKAVTASCSLSGTDAANYSITQPTGLTANITTAALTVTASNQVKCYGYNFSLGTTAFTSSGLAAGDAIASVTLNSDGADLFADPGTYPIIPSDATGVSFSAANYNITYANGTLTVSDIPSFSVDPSTDTQTLCVNGTATALSVSASPGSGTISSYQWYRNTVASSFGGTLIPLATAATYTPSSATAGVFYYYCVVTNSFGCSLPSNVSGATTINALPTIVSVTGGGTVCNNTQLNASNGASGTIYYQGSTLNGTSTATPSTSQLISVTGTYYFRALSAEGCWGPQGSAAVVIQAPIVTGVEICQGATAGSMSTSFTCNALNNQTSGPNDATTGANVTGVGTVAWTNPANIAGTGTAGMTVNSNTTTNYLRGAGYGFSIPSNAIINGITVTINRSTSGMTSPLLRDNVVSLVKGGTIESTNKAVTGTNWPGSLTSATYGGAADLWNSQWTPSDINNANFGVVLSAINSNTGSARTATVDFIRVTVTYSIAGSLDWYTVSSGGTSIGSGSSFNPVGVSGSGISNTNTSGTIAYYVECRTNPGCRGSANYVINALPAAPTAGNAARCGTGTVAISATPGTGLEIDWYAAASGGSALSSSSTSFTTPSISATTVYHAQARNTTTGCVSSSRTAVTATVKSATNSSTSVAACIEYSWNGNTYTNSGTYSYLTTNAAGCDSTATLNLTITPMAAMPTLACYETANFNTTSCSWVVSGTQPVMPTLACYETASFNTTSCSWVVSGTQPAAPTGLACYETANFNTTSCSWVVSGTQPVMPTLACYETASFNTTSCSWVVSGTQPAAPTGLACYETANFNTTSCSWVVSGTQPVMPTLACYETASFNTTTCSWDVSGTQPAAPTGLACYETANFNTSTCSWDVSGTQPAAPTGLACYETANFNTSTCSWDVSGTQPAAPTGLACYETANFNTSTCSWDVSGTQPAAPTGLACYETANFNTTSCSWVVSGTQPAAPTGLACYETASFNTSTCSWDVSGTQPAAPTGLACYETATFNNTTCSWDVTGTEPAPNVTPASACDSYTWSANGQTYTASGSYTVVANCQTDILDLTITASTSNTTVESACSQYTWSVNGQTYTSSGAYTSVTNCATEILNLTIKFPVTKDTTVTACGSYAINGSTYTTSGDYFQNFTAANGCDSTLALHLTINALPTNPGVVTGITEVCNLVGSSTPNIYSISPVAGVASYAWTIPNGATIVSGQGTNSIGVTFTNTLASTNQVIRVFSVSAEGCQSFASSTIVLTKTIPGIPASISGPSNACPFVGAGTASYTCDAVANAATYSWTVPNGASIVSGQGTRTIEVSYSSSFTNGSITVAALSNCGNRSARSFPVNRLTPTAPVAISGPTSACLHLGNGQQVTYSVAPVANASSYTWTVPSTVTIVSGQGSNSIVVTFAGNYVTSVLKVRSVSNCFSSGDRQLQVTAATYAGPGSISGPTNACYYVNNDASATYRIRKVANVPSYIWTVPAGVEVLEHPGGSGANDTSIVVSFNSNFVFGSQILVQTAGCGASAPRALTITGTLVGMAGLISGPTNVCEFMTSSSNPNGNLATYKIPKSSAATFYTWTAPPNTSIVSHPAGTGENDTIVLVKFESDFTTGSIKVKSGNSCGSSVDRTLSVTRLNPATPSSFDVVQVSDCPSRVYTYSLSNMPTNATSIAWTVPDGATIVSGQGTRVLTVSYPPSVSFGFVTAQGINNCASSSIRTRLIKIQACPSSFTSTAPTSKGAVVATEEMAVSVYPNPTTTAFSINLNSRSSEVVKVRVMDMQGRMVKGYTLAASQQMSFGNDLKAGSYMVEFIQGDKKKVQRLMKF